MMKNFNFCVCLLAVLPVFSAAGFSIAEETAQNAQGANAQSTSAVWKIPAVDEVRAELKHWLDSVSASEGEKNVVQEVLKKFDSGSGGNELRNELGSELSDELFVRIIEAMRSVSPPVQNYLKQCDEFAWQELPFGRKLQLPHLPIQVYLDDSSSAKYLKGALRYYLAQKLVQSRLDDEALPVLDELTAENSRDAGIDPPGLLIAQAVVCSHLALPEKGLAALSSFREMAEAAEKNGLTVPRRYTETAKLLEFSMKQEQEKKQPENPQRISQQMDQVRRRLGKGKTDEDTQQAEKDVMKNIDKLIEKVEKQLQQEEQQENQGEQGQQANKPADDSKRLQQKAPGNVDRQDFAQDANWGDLPPKEREEALLKIEKEFPAHYRDIIEQYFREMAGKGQSSE